MKIIKRIILLIAIIFILIVLFNSKTFAYSTNQYSIDIPSNYINQGNGEFVRSTGMPSIIIETDVNTSYEHIEYKKEYLEVFKDMFSSYEDEIAQYIPLGYDYSFQIVDSKITTFTDNNYKCFYFKYKIAIEYQTMYVKQYIVLSGNNIMYNLTLSGTEEALNSAEVKDIVNSFTIKNYIPKDSAFVFPVNNIIITIAIIFILIVVVLYIMKKNDDRKMKFKKSSKPINVDDYSIGNPYNHMNAQAIVNNQNSNSNVISSPYQEEIRQDNKIEKEITVKNTNNSHTNNNITYSASDKNQKQSADNKIKNVFYIILFILIISIIGAIILNNLFMILYAILTVFAYILYPYSCAKSDGEYPKKRALKVAAINSISVAFIFAVVRMFLTGEFSVSIPVAFIYGCINYYLLRETDKEYTTDDRKNDEKLNKLIADIEKDKSLK